MAKESKIQWTDHTWNPWHGCKKVSPGCKYCYMYRSKAQYKQDGSIVQKSKTKFNEPLKWKEPALVFTCSWSDWFIKEADEWRGEAWEVIRKTPHLTYQILTKRPERIEACLPADWGKGYNNVWIGVSVENQKTADERLPILSKMDNIKTKFISFEPLLEEVMLYSAPLRYHFWDKYYSNYGKYIDFENNGDFGWAILGGESGNNTGKWLYREAKLEWFTELVWQLKELEIPIFVKQLGTHLSKELGLKDRHGGNIEEFPKELQVRDMPALEFLKHNEL